MAGGVALNCVANGRIVREAGFEKSGFSRRRATTALRSGARYYGHLAILKKQRSFVDEPCLSRRRSTGRRRAGAAAKTAGSPADNEHDAATTSARETAKLLAEGHVFGWFQGRSEFGPRALGNRSIIADPRDAGMKDKLNKRVKHRQAFRPFAPIVLAERANEIFEGEEESPFMLLVEARPPAMAGQDPGHRSRRRHRARCKRSVRSTMSGFTGCSRNSRRSRVSPSC